MTFIKNLYHDEIREDVLVKSNLKKVWNRQLEIWQEVDRICRKHAITYWAGYGTLLGAVRHKGFIPFDMDIDLCMMRPDYNRFMKILEDELEASGGLFAAKQDFSIVKISHTQTTVVYGEDSSNIKASGICIDVFALDIFEDGTPESSFAVAALQEIYSALFNPSRMKNFDKPVNDVEFLNKIADITDRKAKVEFFLLCAEKLFNQSSAVEWIVDMLNGRYNEPFRKEWFDETIYLPFETVELPAPKKFDEILTSYYGDWRTPVRDDQPRLGIINSPDIPCEDFWRQTDIQNLLRKKVKGGLENWLS